MTKWLYILLSAFLFSVSLLSCTKEELRDVTPKADDRVYFIYMAADNNLAYNAELNLEAIEKGASWPNIGDGRIIVFYDGSGTSKSKMLEFKAGPDRRGMRTVLRTYDEDMNTASPETFKFAVEEMKAFATADGRHVSSYILDVWSHGNSWEPGTPAPLSLFAEDEHAIMPTAVVNDGSYWMNLEDFAEAIEPGLFDAIVFAECYGAGVEMVYLLRDKTNYVIGSAAEMPVRGIQYDRALTYIFQEELDYEGFCRSYYDYWSVTDPYTATIAWFDCRAFSDQFIATMRNIYSSAEYSDAISRFNAAANVDAIGVQYYDRTQKPRRYYDLGDFVNAVFPGGGTLHDEFWRQYDKIVRYASSTPGIWSHYDGHEIDPARFSGMTTYMMLDRNDIGYDYNTKNTQYRQTAWYKAVYP